MAPTRRVTRCSSDDSSGGGPRGGGVYAEPWDAWSGGSSPALDGSQSDFSCYRPRYPDSLSSATGAVRYRLAGVDEQHFCNERYRRRPTPALCDCDHCPDPELYHDFYEEIPYPCSGACELYSASLSLRRCSARVRDDEPSLVYVYESGGSRRTKMALPKRDCMLDWEESLRVANARCRSRLVGGWLAAELSDDASASSSCDERASQSCEDEESDAVATAAAAAVCGCFCDAQTSSFPASSSCYVVGGAAFPPPQHFGLSRYGHLKIDYSCSWDYLDKYIAAAD